MARPSITTSIAPGSRSRIGKMMTPRLGELRDMVVVCTLVERPDGEVSTIVTRPGVIQVHARVRPVRGEAFLDYQINLAGGSSSRFGPPTHEITIRTPPDIAIATGHWVYHCDKFAETWYRVRTVEDIGGAHRFTVMLCAPDTVRDRRSDPATQQSPPTWEVPDMPVPSVI
jgi:hypothetical protein